MSMAEPKHVETGVSILTSVFQVRGKLHVLGTMQNFLNDEQKPTLTVYKAEATGISSGNPAAHMSQPEMVINKRSMQMIAFEVAPSKDTLVMLPNIQPLMLYTDQFAIAGKFHLGPDAHLTDFAEASLQDFIVASEVKIYPMFPARTGLIQSAPVIVIHKAQIRLYHKA